MQITKAAPRGLFLEISLCAAILFLLAQACFAADVITGVVRNASKAQPAAGDEVFLLDLERSPHQEARTRIDSQGKFTLELHDPGHPHIVRVIHQGVTYDRQVSRGEAVSIDVFDSAAKVQGISGSIEIIRASTNGKTLHVSDMIEIRNQSNPPVTQAGAQTFEVYLPGNATSPSILAAGPDHIAVSISAELVQGEPGHYTVNLPLRPGATKFAFNYDVPYNGRARFLARTSYPFQQLAVMVPPTMRFVTRSSAFQPLPVGGDRYRVVAAENVKAGAELGFELSGAGTIPATRAERQTPLNRPAGIATTRSASAATGTSPTENGAGRAGQAAKFVARSPILWWWGLVAALVALVAYAFFGWRWRWFHPRIASNTPAERRMRQPGYILDALKQDLFQLEGDHRQGVIRGEDYTAARHALEITIARALTRTQNERASAAPR